MSIFHIKLSSYLATALTKKPSESAIHVADGVRAVVQNGALFILDKDDQATFIAPGGTWEKCVRLKDEPAK